MITRTKTKKPAFTLVEILVTISMLILILASAYGTYTAATRSVTHSKPKHTLQRQAIIFNQTVVPQLRCCYSGRYDKPPENKLDTIQVKKELSNQERIPLFIGGEVSSGKSFLRFTTSAETSKSRNSFGGLSVIEYAFDQSANTISAKTSRYDQRQSFLPSGVR